eukprot:12903695-Prorocentrum_lima.AAC.2
MSTSSRAFHELDPTDGNSHAPGEGYGGRYAERVRFRGAKVKQWYGSSGVRRAAHLPELVVRPAGTR